MTTNPSTYQAVFGQFYQVRFADKVLNRVIIAAKSALPEIRSLLPRVNEMTGLLQPMGVDVLNLYQSITAEVNWDTSARILTDQYSPANLLKGD